jgi:hypothetical protein
MATTTFAVRQFFNIASEYGTFNTSGLGVFVVTGSVSRLLINNTRTNLSVDSFSMDTSGGGTVTFNSGTSDGWWPGASTDSALYGIIVGGNDGYGNSSPDGRTSTVSCWGWIASEDQPSNDAEFIALAGSVLGATYANTGSAKTALRNAGFYYQYPVGYDGQSPNTGTGSDTV